MTKRVAISLGLLGLISGVAIGLVGRFSSSVLPKKTTDTNIPILPSPDLHKVNFANTFDPFYSEPCFLRLHNSCQMVLSKVDGKLRLTPEIVGGLEGSNNQSFFWGRELAVWNSVKEYAIIYQPDDQLGFYADYLGQISQASTKNNLNQAFLFILIDTFYEHSLQLVEESILRSQFPVSPDLLAREVSDALGGRSAFPDSINSLTWSKSGKAVLLASGTMFPPEIVEAMFAETGYIERKYLKFFSPPWSFNMVPRFNTTGVSEESLFSEPTDINIAFYDLVICDEKVAYACAITTSEFSCDATLFFSQFCQDFIFQY